MRCPACQQAIAESAESCACGFSLAALDRLLGIPPSLKVGVTDMVSELTSREIKLANAEMARLERRFPQCQFAVVVCAAPENITLPLYTFWLFNRGGLASAVDKGGMNRMVLLSIDAHAGKAACMIGYGLEPFVAEARITAALNAAFPALATDHPGKAMEDFFKELERQLTEASTGLEKVFGLGTIEVEGLEDIEGADESHAAAY